MTKQVEQKNFRKNYYTTDDSGKIYLLGLLVPFAVLFVWTMVGQAICSASGAVFNTEQPPLWFTIIYAILGQLTFLLVFILYNKASKTAFSAARVKKLSSGNVLICILVALVALFGLQFFVSTVDHLLELIGFGLKDSIATIPLNNAGWLFVYIGLYALLPAICEELIFRGVVLTGLRSHFSDLSAVALSALLFALMHGSLQQLVYPFLLGLIFGLLVIRTGSTLASMLVHFVNNTLVVIFAYLQTNYNFALFNFRNSWWFYLLSVLLLIATGVIIFLIDKFYFKHKNSQDKAEGSDENAQENAVMAPAKGRVSLFLWIGLAVGFAYLIFATIMNFMGPT